MNVSLTPELEKFVEKQVASQRYQTASEVVRQALRQMQLEEQMKQAQLEAIRHGLIAAEQQIDNKQFIDIVNDNQKGSFLEQVRRRGRERMAKQRRKA